MTKTILVLALIAILSPFGSAQFSQNFTSVLLSWGNRSVLAVPANVTDADGTQYWDLERGSVDEPEGEWTLELINADGTSTNFIDNNNDLVSVNPDGSQTSIASQIPPLLGITGGELVGIVQNNVEAGVESVYSDGNFKNITNAQANQRGQTVVDEVLASSGLPSFFLTSFRTQAYSQIAGSLSNAQAVSAAINASIVANTPNTTNTTTPVGNTVNIPLNLTDFELSSLDNIKEINATWGTDHVDVMLGGEVAGSAEDDSAAWLVNLEAGNVESGDSEWALQWTDIQGNSFSLQDQNGTIVVVGDDGTETTWTDEAAWFVNNGETTDLNAAIGDSIEDFVDAVIANAGTNNGSVIINVGPQGLNWTYPATEVNSTA